MTARTTFTAGPIASPRWRRFFGCGALEVVLEPHRPCSILVGPDRRVGTGATFQEGVVVGGGVVVEAGAHVGAQALLGHHVQVLPGVSVPPHAVVAPRTNVHGGRVGVFDWTSWWDARRGRGLMLRVGCAEHLLAEWSRRLDALCRENNQPRYREALRHLIRFLRAQGRLEG